MKISTNKSKTDPPKKTTTVKTDRHYSDAADAKRQQSQEGKNTPFQTALRDAEGRNRKVFHWHDKKQMASDTPFNGSRPIATRSSNKKVEEEKPVSKISPMQTSTKEIPAKTKVPMVQAKANDVKVKPVYDQDHKGKRTHGTVKNTLLRKIDAAVQPGKYGAVSNGGKNVNINRATTHKSDKPDVKGYKVDLGDGKNMQVKKLKPKAILKEARAKGYIQ